MTSTRYYSVMATKSGRKMHASATPGTRGLFEFDSLADAGMVRVLSHGAENVYFEWISDEGFTESGYCKCL